MLESEATLDSFPAAALAKLAIVFDRSSTTGFVSIAFSLTIPLTVETAS